MFLLPGPKVTLQVKLTEAFQAKDSMLQMYMLEKVVLRRGEGCWGLVESSREWGSISDHVLFSSLFPRSVSSSTSHQGPTSPSITQGHHTTSPAEPEAGRA